MYNEASCSGHDHTRARRGNLTITLEWVWKDVQICLAIRDISKVVAVDAIERIVRDWEIAALYSLQWLPTNDITDWSIWNHRKLELYSPGRQSKTTDAIEQSSEETENYGCA